MYRTRRVVHTFHVLDHAFASPALIDPTVRTLRKCVTLALSTRALDPLVSRTEESCILIIPRAVLTRNSIDAHPFSCRSLTEPSKPKDIQPEHLLNLLKPACSTMDAIDTILLLPRGRVGSTTLNQVEKGRNSESESICG